MYSKAHIKLNSCICILYMGQSHMGACTGMNGGIHYIRVDMKAVP